MLITVHKPSLWRLYFHRCLSVNRGSRSLSRGVSIPGGLCPGGSLSRRGLCPGGVSVQGVSVHGGVSVWGSLSRGVCHEDPPRTVMSGRYTSYWNAFLFLEGILDIPCNKICCILCKKIQFFSISYLILDLCEQHKQKIQFNLCLIISW